MAAVQKFSEVFLVFVCRYCLWVGRRTAWVKTARLRVAIVPTADMRKIWESGISSDVLLEAL